MKHTECETKSFLSTIGNITNSHKTMFVGESAQRLEGLEVSDQVGSFLFRVQTSEGHSGT